MNEDYMSLEQARAMKACILHYPAEVYDYGHKCNCGTLVPATGADWRRHVSEYGGPAKTPMRQP